MQRMLVRILLVTVSLFAAGRSAGAQTPPASDQAAGNQAFILQLGGGQQAAIEQRNIEGGLLSGAIRQTGIGNEAGILMEGGDLSGSILQQGNGNVAELEIRGRNNSGAIEQYNGANSGGLKIEGDGKDVTLIQNGGLQTPGLPIRIGGDAPPAALPITVRQY